MLVGGMTHALSYSTPEILRWRSRAPELSWEQAELNAGARRIYAARRVRASGPCPRLFNAALPAPFAPPPLAPPPPRRWAQ